MKYAKGRKALAECMRSGKRLPYKDLVRDGHIDGLLVAPEWWEPKHPQEIPVRVDDPIALENPSPEISKPSGEGNPMEGSTCGPSPNLSYLPSTSLAASLAGGEYVVPLEDARTFKFGSCIYIQRNDLSWFMSRIQDESDAPTFTVRLLTAFSGGAAMGNEVYLSSMGDGVPV